MMVLAGTLKAETSQETLDDQYQSFDGVSSLPSAAVLPHAVRPLAPKIFPYEGELSLTDNR
jgi:hypothetical protein